MTNIYIVMAGQQMKFGASDFLDASIEAKTTAELWQMLIDFVKSIDAIRVGYHHLPPIGARDYFPFATVKSYGFPEEWRQLYRKKRYYLVDPIVEAIRSKTTPIWWAEVEQEENLSQAARNYMAEMKSSKLGKGLAVPVFGPNGRNGYYAIGFGFTAPKLQSRDMRTLQSACNHAHLRYCELLLQGQEKIGLSRREIDTMRYMAKGMTTAEIASKMSVSAATVQTNKARAYEKLGVTDKVTATLRCIAAGYFYY